MSLRTSWKLTYPSTCHSDWPSQEDKDGEPKNCKDGIACHCCWLFDMKDCHWYDSNGSLVLVVGGSKICPPKNNLLCSFTIMRLMSRSPLIQSHISCFIDNIHALSSSLFGLIGIFTSYSFVMYYIHTSIFHKLYCYSTVVKSNGWCDINSFRHQKCHCTLPQCIDV